MLTNFLIGIVFPINSVLGATVVRQEFTGNLSLAEVSRPEVEEFITLPEESAYSGFIVYEEDGTLLDWELDVDQPSLSLAPDSTSDSETPPDFGFPEPSPTVNFSLSSAEVWSLQVDFGIALDAPRYTLERTSDEIALTSEIGFVGSYTYVDSDPSINLISSSDTSNSIPEPGTIFGTLVACGMGISLLKRSRLQ